MKCTCQIIDGVKKQCKRCYDENRYLKMRSGDWKFNPKPPETLSDIQEQVLIGGLLGDTHIYAYEHHITVGLAIGRAIKDKEYLQYQFDIFRDFCSSDIKERAAFDKRTNKNYICCSFRTQCAEVFVPFRNKWYPNGIKIVPKDLQLTPLICAIWFCDDGSITYLGKNKTGRRISLYTDNFTKKEAAFLQKLLQKTLNIVVKITRKKSMKNINKGFYLYISKKDDVIKFIDYIKNVMPLSMSRKSDRWKGFV